MQYSRAYPGVLNYVQVAMATGPSGAQADDTAIVIQIRGQSPQMDLRKK